ncbi:MAG: replication-relaxation family protein [Alphaproteobacteria bacterium]
MTDDDAMILRHIYRHRFISSEDLCRLFPERSEDKLSRRLTLLYRAGFLDRPTSQVDYHMHGGGSKALVHGLDNEGARFLKDKLGIAIDTGNWRIRNRAYKKDSLDHTLAVTKFLVDVEVSCRERKNIEYIPFDEILKRAPIETQRSPTPMRMKVPISWQGNRGTVLLTPDAIFGLRVTGGEGVRKESYVFLEIDRGSMTIVPAERTRETEAFLHRTSVLRKFVCYAEGHRQGLPRKVFGIQSARVLTLTVSEDRSEVMRNAAEAHVVKPMRVPPGLFLFGVQSSLKNALEANFCSTAKAEVLLQAC